MSDDHSTVMVSMQLSLDSSDVAIYRDIDTSVMPFFG